MPHLVTGAKGEAHVSSLDVSCLNAGTWGKGGTVLQTRNNLTCSLVQNSGKVQVQTGDCIICGRQVSIEEPETIELSPGTVGKNRIDYVVLRVSITSKEEKCELALVKGTETTSSSPTAPSLKQQDLTNLGTVYEFPLARLTFTGLSVSCDQVANPTSDLKAKILEDKLGGLLTVVQLEFSNYQASGNLVTTYLKSGIPSGYTAVAIAGWNGGNGQVWSPNVTTWLFTSISNVDVGWCQQYVRLLCAKTSIVR